MRRHLRITLVAFAFAALLAGLGGVSAAYGHGRPNDARKHAASTPLTTCTYPAVTSNAKNVYVGSTYYGDLYVDLGQDTCNHQVYQSFGSFTVNGKGGCSNMTIVEDLYYGANLINSQATGPIYLGPSGCNSSQIVASYETTIASGTSVHVCATITFFGSTQDSICTSNYVIP